MTDTDSDSRRANPLARVARSLWLWVPLALLIAVRAILPFALERAIPWYAERESGADVEIENIDLALLGGRFRIEGLRVANPLRVESAAIPAASPLPQAPAAATPEAPTAATPESPAAATPESTAAATPESTAAVTPESTAAVTAREEPGRDLVSLVRLELEIDWFALFTGEVSLPRIQLDGLTLRARQNRDGSIALPTRPSIDDEEDAEVGTSPESAGEVAVADATSPSAAPQEAAPGETEVDGHADEAADWRFRIGHFELNEPDFALYSERAGGEVAKLTLRRFAVDALRSGPAGFGLDEIALDDPEVFIDRDWLFDPGFARGGEATLKSESRPPALQIARLAIDSGHFQIRSLQGPIELAIRIEILQFDTEPGHAFPIALALEVGEGGASLDGRLGIFPPSFEGELAWHQLSVPPYLLLTTPAIVPWLASCNTEGRIEVSFHSEEPAQLVLRGKSRLSNLVFREPETGELAVEAEEVEMTVREARYPLAAGQPRHVDVALLAISKPKVVFTNPPNALDELLAIYSSEPRHDEAAAHEGAAAELPPPTRNPDETPAREREADSAITLAIDRLAVSDGELVFVDRSVTPRHETRVRDFRLEAADLTTSPAGAARIEMAGVIQRKGTFEIRGKLPGGNGSLHLEVRRLDLARYDGFARRAGLHLDSGDASLESAIQLRDGRVEADNDLVLHDLSVDSTKPGAFKASFGISLDLALALLRGPGGDIELELPVTFDKGGGGVGMGSVIRSALREALKGALTSPLKVVGGLLPRASQPASLEPIDFEPGAVELNARARKRIASLIDLLKDRPGLGFTVSGQTAPADERSLAVALLQDRAASGKGLPELEGAGFFARRRLATALRERAEGGEGWLDPADETLLSRYVDAQQVPKERYDALATARAQSVANALSAAGAPEGALTIGAPETADTPGVVVELALRNPDQAGPSE